MPWKVTCPMEERIKFISHYFEGELSMAALCRAFGISRKTGYKLVRRYIEDSVDGLKDRSRAPLHHPNAVGSSVVEAVVAARHRHPSRITYSIIRKNQCPVRHPPRPTVGFIALSSDCVSHGCALENDFF